MTLGENAHRATLLIKGEARQCKYPNVVSYSTFRVVHINIKHIMASNTTQFQFRSFMICDVSRVYISTELKSFAIQGAVAIINIAIALFGTLANGLVIMAYYHNPRLRTIQNTIFLLLAITDFSVTAFVEPIYVAAIFDSILRKRPRCLLWNVSGVLSTLFVQLSLLASVILTLQSYITLAYPYHYQRVITKSRLIITMVFSFLLVASLTLNIFLSRHILLYGSLALMLTSIVSVVLTWCWTYKLVARHRKAIQKTQTPSTSQNISQKKILRSTITALVIIADLLVCYSLALVLFFSEKLLDPTKSTFTYSIRWTIATTLVFLNSLLNPCLVFWRSSSFRETVQNIFI